MSECKLIRSCPAINSTDFHACVHFQTAENQHGYAVGDGPDEFKTIEQKISALERITREFTFVNNCSTLALGVLRLDNLIATLKMSLKRGG